MKIRAISFALCFVLSLTLNGQTNPETPETPTTPKEETEKQSEIEKEIEREIEERERERERERAERKREWERSEREQAEREREWDDDNDDDVVRGITINFNDHDYNRNKLRIGMVDFGISTYIDENNSLDLEDNIDYMDQRLGRSINIGIHLVNLKLSLRRKAKPQNFGFSTGIKWNIVHYSMEKDYAVSKNQDRFQDGIDFNVPALKHNRLKANHIQIPFLLEFNSRPSKPSKSFNLALGMTYQLLLNSNYKYKTEEGVKNKIKGDFNLAKSMALLEVRAGYGPLNFYVQYGPRLFQENDGPNLQPLNIGINLIPR